MPPDELTITAKNVNGNLELWVTNNNDTDARLNGRYYSAPAASIKSLTIRGTHDHETIFIEGPLGLSGDKTITIVGREGDDTIRVKGIGPPGPNNYYGTIKVDGGAGVNRLYIDDYLSDTDNTYTVTGTSVTSLGRPPIEYAAISALSLAAGSGTNVVNIDGVPGTLKLDLAGGPGRDKLVVTSGHANDPILRGVPSLTGFEELVISGGKLTLNTTALPVENMTQSGGTLEGTADVSASKSLVWSGGIMQGTGKTVSLNTSAMTLSGAPTLTGRTLENQGTGHWNQAAIVGGGTLRNTGYLSGTGTLTGTLVNAGSLLPGSAASPAGTITVQGAFESPGTLVVDLGATSDQVAAQAVTLGGALSPTSVAGFPADKYTLVSNTGQGKVTGTFFNRAEGAIVEVAGVRYRITYAGGDGNDVVLERVAQVSNRVWNDRNYNGIQDDDSTPGDGHDDSGVYGAAASLYTSAGAFVGSTSTDVNGLYSFADLRPGDYYLVFGRPAGYKFTKRDLGSDSSDSDANRDSETNPGRTATFTLAPGQVDDTRDAGLYQLASVGNWVWQDHYRWDPADPPSGDGLQNEPYYAGVGGIGVHLFIAQGPEVAATTTDQYGYYSFAGLEPGEYRVTFDLPPDQSGPDESGFYYVTDYWEFTQRYIGSNPAYDSDADSAGSSGDFTLQSGQALGTIDAGLVHTYYSAPMFAASFDQASVDGRADAIATTAEEPSGLITVGPGTTAAAVEAPADGPTADGARLSAPAGGDTYGESPRPTGPAPAGRASEVAIAFLRAWPRGGAARVAPALDFGSDATVTGPASAPVGQIPSPPRRAVAASPDDTRAAAVGPADGHPSGTGIPAWWAPSRPAPVDWWVGAGREDLPIEPIGVHVG